MKKSLALSVMPFLLFLACSSSRSVRLDADGGLLKYRRWTVAPEGERQDALAKAEAHCKQNGFSSFTVTHETEEHREGYIEFKCTSSETSDRATSTNNSCLVSESLFRASCSNPFPSSLGFNGNASCVDFYGDDVSLDKVESQCKGEARATRCPTANVSFSCRESKSKRIAITHYYLSSDENSKAQQYNMKLVAHGCSPNAMKCP
jgi:hypothetical protein